jgi:hypothetical protein
VNLKSKNEIRNKRSLSLGVFERRGERERERERERDNARTETRAT